MFNKDFLKTLTILYAEDDSSIRTSLSNILKKVFKEVIICEDGQIGVDKYKELSSSIEFDAIVSDINMPNLDGLEMVKQIRVLNSDIPVIMTTAHGEANYLMEAIKVNVSGYSLKPIDTKDLLVTIQKFCEIKRNQKLIIEKEAELSEYMDLINSLATITKVDNDDKIVHSNDFFQAVSDYDKEELENKSILDIIHSDSAKTSYFELKKTIKSSNTWKGKLKLLRKDDEKFHLRTTAIPQKDLDTGAIKGYVSIGFLADDEEQEKAQTMQQVKANMLEQKQKVLFLNKKVKELLKNQGSPQSSTFLENEKILKRTLKDERMKSLNFGKQLKYYEQQIVILQTKLDNIMDMERIKRDELTHKIKIMSQENDGLKNNLITAQNKLNASKPKPKYVE